MMVIDWPQKIACVGTALYLHGYGHALQQRGFTFWVMSKMRNHKVLLTSSKPQEVPAIQPTILLPSSSIKQQIPATMPPLFLPLYQIIYTKPTSSLSQTSASNATQRNTLPPLKHLLRSSQTELHSQRIQNFCTHRLTPSSINQNCFSSRLTPSSIT